MLRVMRMSQKAQKCILRTLGVSVDSRWTSFSCDTHCEQTTSKTQKTDDSQELYPRNHRH